MPKLTVIIGDITKLKVDAIVNAANEDLAPGAGVCGAIFSGAGQLLEKECESIGGCSPGDAVITGAYDLPAEWIIHAVGPVYFRDPQSAPQLLESTYKNALKIAQSKKLNSIAFPCISTGIYGYPKPEAAKIAVTVAKSHVGDFPKEIVFCCFGDADFKIYLELIKNETKKALVT